MPRAARSDNPGLLHHIMTRGIERRKGSFGAVDFKFLKIARCAIIYELRDKCIQR